MLTTLTMYNEEHSGQRSRAFIIFLEPLMKHFNSFLSATTRCCGGVEHNLVFISVNSRVDLLIFERSSVFPRDGY